MTKFVSYVPDETIEKDAQALLAEYAHARGVVTEAPIAIDDIIEKHLTPTSPTRADFCDFRRAFRWQAIVSNDPDRRNRL